MVYLQVMSNDGMVLDHFGEITKDEYDKIAEFLEAGRYLPGVDSPIKA